MNVFMKVLKKGLAYALPLGLAAAALITEKMVDDKEAEAREAESEPKDNNDETTKVDEKNVKVEDEDGKEAK